VSDHPRTFFQEDHQTDNPAVLMYACEGLDDSDIRLPEDADGQEKARSFAIVRGVEARHRSMFYQYGCEVSKQKTSVGMS